MSLGYERYRNKGIIIIVIIIIIIIIIIILKNKPYVTWLQICTVIG